MPESPLCKKLVCTRLNSMRTLGQTENKIDRDTPTGYVRTLPPKPWQFGQGAKEMTGQFKPAVSLAGLSGPGRNAAVLFRKCMDAARAAGWNAAQRHAFTLAFIGGDYDDALATVREHFEMSDWEEEDDADKAR